jgi:hypothetical protein
MSFVLVDRTDQVFYLGRRHQFESQINEWSLLLEHDEISMGPKPHGMSSI